MIFIDKIFIGKIIFENTKEIDSILLDETLNSKYELIQNNDNSILLKIYELPIGNIKQAKEYLQKLKKHILSKNSEYILNKCIRDLKHLEDETIYLGCDNNKEIENLKEKINNLKA